MMGTIVVGALVLLAVGNAMYCMIKDKKAGKRCASCSGCSECKVRE